MFPMPWSHAQKLRGRWVGTAEVHMCCACQLLMTHCMLDSRQLYSLSDALLSLSVRCLACVFAE
jgi:hypothetical protein